MESERTLQTVIAGLASHGEAPALIAFGPEGAARLSHTRLQDRVMRRAGWLIGRGYGKGVPVAVIAANSAALVELRLALAAVGAVAVPLDDMGSPADFRRAIENSGARALFASAEILRTLAGDLPVPRGAVFEIDDARADGPPAEALPPLAASDLAAIIYTSGTTGAAKGVPLTHGNFLVNIEALAGGGFLGAHDRVLLPLPLHHSYPFMAGLMTPLACGAAVILPAGVTGPEIAEALREGEATVMAGVPRLYEAMAQGIAQRLAGQAWAARRLFGALWRLSTAVRRRTGVRLGRWLMRPVRRRFAPRLRLLASGGAKLDPEVAWRLEGLGFEVLSGYGLVETASVTTYNRAGAGRIGTEGRAVEGTGLRIAEADAAGIGEVQIKGPHVFAGYYRDPEATAAAFTADGWFRTGDLGRIDADGALEILGRSKEVIVLSGGKNVGPEEVETALNAHPYVAESAVLEKDGDLVALIVPDEAALRAAQTLRLEDAVRVAVSESCAGLAPYKRVTGYRTVHGPLPKTRLGKLRRFRLPALYAQAGRAAAGTAAAPDPADAALLADPRAAAALAAIRRRFADAAVGLDTSPQLDLGVDSLGWLDLAGTLEAEAGAALPPEALAGVVTVRDLLRAVAAAPAPAETAPSEVVLPAPPRGVRRAVGWTVYWLNRCVIRLLFRLRVEGRPPSTARPVLIAANHASDLDPFVLAAALPWRTIRDVWWGADRARVFGSRALGWLAGCGQAFPIDDRRPGESLAVAGGLLDRGDSLAWFPESWRTPDGRLQAFMPGVGVLIADHAPAVCPVYIAGTFEALPRHRRRPRLVPVTVRFGETVPAAALGPSGGPAIDALRARMAALAPPEPEVDAAG